ncbi:MAG TPA: DUF4384 domain-containing protein [Blastocatellia bacterium]|nr:DUF4384 domain-containing protein [Blastocatellia bacterium]
MSRFASVLLLLCSLVICAQSAQNTQNKDAQDKNDDTRGIIPEEFAKARPAKGQHPNNASHKTSYRRIGPKPATDSKVTGLGQLGVTVWRLRPATAADSGARIIVHKESGDAELIPQRLSIDTPLHVRDRIRLTFESPQEGFLYVIDREQYADGTFGEPVLIFPTTRLHNGDNQVAAGKLIEIPAQEDQPNYFTVEQSQGREESQTGEVLTVIVAAKPLTEITIGREALKINAEQLAHWEKQWGGKTEVFDLVGGEGRSWTRVEQEAGAGTSRQLTQTDPEPQTVYRVAVKSGSPLLVNVGLRYSKTTSASPKQKQ